MARLKPSAYNFLLPQEDQSYVLYNSASGHITRLDNATGRAAMWLLQHPNHPNPLSRNLSKLKKGLIRRSFFVSDSVDELDAICKRHRIECDAVRGLNLTIAASLACNFGCSYCSQDRELGHMSSDIADRLVQFVRRMLPDKTALSVTWYGGEPLLNKPVVERLSREFLNICKDGRSRYSAFMITNGYRLNKATAKALAKSKIRDFQITIDGDRKVHDRNRPLLGGQGTYDIVLKNVCDILPDVKSIALRINVLRSTMLEVAETYRALSRLADAHKNLYVYLARVFDTGDGGVSAEDFLSPDEFARFVEELDASAESEPEDDLVPAPIESYCCADRLDSFVVDPAGNLFKCWNSVGRGDESIGHVASYTAAPNRWLQFDPTEDLECRDCKFLPICLGGCPDVRFESKGGRKECCSEKFVIQARLAKWARAATA